MQLRDKISIKLIESNQLRFSILCLFYEYFGFLSFKGLSISKFFDGFMVFHFRDKKKQDDTDQETDSYEKVRFKVTEIEYSNVLLTKFFVCREI
jgi:hypothetical protein